MTCKNQSGVPCPSLFQPFSTMAMWRKRILQAVQSSTITLVKGRCSIDSSCSRSITSEAVSGRSCAVLWGNGDYGRLGLGSLESKWTPQICSFFTNEEDDPVAIACGGAHTLFLTEKGRVFSCGLNSFGQLGTEEESAKSHVLEPLEVIGFPDTVVKISAGYYHSAAITKDGELFMWGKNSCGQLGLGKRSASIVPKPARVDSLVGFHVKMVALGSEHSIAVTDEDGVLSWGEGSSGRLGHGHQSGILGFPRSSREYVPRLIKHFENVKVKKIAAGLLHSACIDEKGSLFIFGEPGFRESANASKPSMIYELPLSEEVACGGYHTCVVTSGGELYSWGANENGCLGFGSIGTFKSPEKIEGALMDFSISEVSCGWKHTAAVSGGNVFTWGWGGANGTFFEEGHSSAGQLIWPEFDLNTRLKTDLTPTMENLTKFCRSVNPSFTRVMVAILIAFNQLWSTSGEIAKHFRFPVGLTTQVPYFNVDDFVKMKEKAVVRRLKSIGTSFLQRERPNLVTILQDKQFTITVWTLEFEILHPSRHLIQCTPPP